MKTYYTEKAWHRAAVEDPRNPSFTIHEIQFQKTGDTLVITDDEYFEVESVIDDLQEPDDGVLLDGEEYYGDQQDILDAIKVYKVIDHDTDK